MLLSRIARVLVLAAGGLLGACSPELKEGHYSCVDDDGCPDGWICDDNLCYSSALARPIGGRGGSGTSGGPSGNDDAGMGTAGGSDAGTSAGGGSGGIGTGGSGPRGGTGGIGPVGGVGGPPPAAGSGGTSGTPSVEGAYAECSIAEPSCETGTCVLGPDNGAENGTCAPACSGSGACPANDGAEGVCLNMVNACLRACDSADDCPDSLGCHDVAIAMGQTIAACVEVKTENLLGTASCTPGNMASCGRGAACAFSPAADAVGVCSYRCDQSRACPDGGTCLQLSPDVRQCFKPCDGGTTDCGDLTCGTFAGMQLCVPSGWNGLAALPPPM